MDIKAINQNYQQPSAAHGIKATSAPVAKKSDVENTNVKIPAVDKVEIRATESERKDAVKRAATASLKNTYAVSDTSFTIFKDSQGEFVTRVKSLRDGSFTYIPEPDLLRQMELGGVDKSILRLNA